MTAPRRLRGKKLLVAKLGLGALTIVAASAFPACNLLPPPPCTDGGGAARGSCDDPPDAQPDAPSDADPGDADPGDV